MQLFSLALNPNIAYIRQGGIKEYNHVDQTGFLRVINFRAPYFLNDALVLSE